MRTKMDMEEECFGICEDGGKAPEGTDEAVKCRFLF